MTRTKAIASMREMLTYCRPAGSKTDREFCDRFLRPIGCVQDAHGNYHRHVPGTGSDRVLWSAHTDTVHARAGRQFVDRSGPYLHLPDTSRSSCLGADDTIGVWILINMITAGVPGRYVFHFAEEIGCVGSRALARTPPEWFADLHFAIALDRKGTTDVITHMGVRTASDRFAADLAHAIGLEYAPSDLGILTDTIEYIDLIPECTNVSIGYERAHTPGEYCDADHAIALLDRLSALDVSALTPYREPETFVDDWPEDWPEDQPLDDRHEYLDPEYAALAEFFRKMGPRHDR